VAQGERKKIPPEGRGKQARGETSTRGEEKRKKMKKRERVYSIWVRGQSPIGSGKKKKNRHDRES